MIGASHLSLTYSLTHPRSVAIVAHLHTRTSICVPVPKALVALTMVSKEKQKFIKEVQDWAQEKCGGSGNPEIEDAVGVIDYFENIFGQQLPVFQKLLQDMCARAQSLDTSSTRNPGIQNLPEVPEEGETKKFILDPRCLGFRASDAVKGKSKMPHIFKCLVDFLEKPYASAAEPLDVLMPEGLSCGSALPAFSVHHNVGFAKSLSPGHLVCRCGHALG